jgi:hypothetical protein
MKPLTEIHVAEPVSVQNLTIFPLLRETEDTDPEYIASSVAIEKHGMRVEEIVEAGSVPNLMVVNPASIAVLLIDGEELRGAKQNRIVNTTILIPPESRTKIDVSCTESGRWSYNSATFSHSKTIMSAKSRRRKSRAVSDNLKACQTYASNQGEVWQEVDELNAKMGSHSHTSAMAAAYESAKMELNQAVDQCIWTDNQCGILAFIDGKPVGMDVLSRKGVYKEVHSQLIQSYAMEALANERVRLRTNPANKEKDQPENPALAKAEAFLERSATIEGNSYPSVGMGEDFRFQHENILGSGLKIESTWVHLAYFLEDETDRSLYHRRYRIVRASRRRDNRR